MNNNIKAKGVYQTEKIRKNLPRNIIVLSIFVLLLVIEMAEIGMLKKTLSTTTGEKTSLVSQLDECKSTVSVNNAVGNLNEGVGEPSFPSYGNNPLYPGYTIGWKLYINERKNYLFLHPEKFRVMSSGNNLFDEVELSDSGRRKIIIQRLDDITNHQKSLEFEAFIDKLSKGENVQSEDGYNVMKNSDLVSNGGVTFLKEYKEGVGTVYYSVIIRHLGWPEVTRVRTENLSIDDLRAIAESFKYLRDN